VPKPNSFRPLQPEQTTLLPASRREWLSDDHQVYFLLDLVDELDLSQDLIPVQAKEPRWLTSRYRRREHEMAQMPRFWPASDLER
jgi:hypothetical protein